MSSDFLQISIIILLKLLSKIELAPRVGLEPTAYRLTAECSTIELPWNNTSSNVNRFIS